MVNWYYQLATTRANGRQFASFVVVPMKPDNLGGEDAAWLHMEEATNPMVVNGVVQLAAPLPLERAYGLFERMASIPHFRARVVEPALGVGPPHWEPVADFHLGEHIERVELADATDDTLSAFIGQAVSRLLDLHRPLWHVYLIDRPGMGTTVLYRVHHSIADGFALLAVLLSLCDDDGNVTRDPTPKQATTPPHAIIGAAKALGRLVVLPADPKSLLKGRLGPDKLVAWSRPLALAEIKEAARASSATINDVLVAVAAGAIGRYLARRGECHSALEVRAMVPVNLRTPAASGILDNRFGLVVLGLPVGVRDPAVRVAAVKQRMQQLKATPEAVATHALLGAMGLAPRAVEDRGVTFFGTKSSLVLTNVPGPRVRLSLAGIPVTRIMFWVPQSGRMGLGLSIFSYAGEVTIGVLADKLVIPDPDVLVVDLHAELDALLAQIRERGKIPATGEARQVTR